MPNLKRMSKICLFSFQCVLLCNLDLMHVHSLNITSYNLAWKIAEMLFEIKRVHNLDGMLWFLGQLAINSLGLWRKYIKLLCLYLQLTKIVSKPHGMKGLEAVQIVTFNITSESDVGISNLLLDLIQGQQTILLNVSPWGKWDFLWPQNKQQTSDLCSRTFDEKAEYWDNRDFSFQNLWLAQSGPAVEAPTIPAVEGPTIPAIEGPTEDPTSPTSLQLESHSQQDEDHEENASEVHCWSMECVLCNYSKAQKILT